LAFKIGKSGNPAGRPKGSRDKRTVFKEMLEPKSSQLIQKAIEMALDGNEAMLRLLLDRVLPAKLREDPMPINIKCDSLVGQSKIILEELAKGTITSSCAKNLMDTVSVEARIFETEELTKRLEKVEKAVKFGISDEDFIEDECTKPESFS
jgi:hypothetical protein